MVTLPFLWASGPIPNTDSLNTRLMITLVPGHTLPLIIVTTECLIT
jgi:hypothetical protein